MFVRPAWLWWGGSSPRLLLGLQDGGSGRQNTTAPPDVMYETPEATTVESQGMPQQAGLNSSQFVPQQGGSASQPAESQAVPQQAGFDSSEFIPQQVGFESQPVESQPHESQRVTQQTGLDSSQFVPQQVGPGSQPVESQRVPQQAVLANQPVDEGFKPSITPPESRSEPFHSLRTFIPPHPCENSLIPYASENDPYQKFNRHAVLSHVLKPQLAVTTSLPKQKLHVSM